MSARYIVGDSVAVLRSLPDASADLVLTSPPFLALRSYLPPDHPDKASEIGSEATPGAFIDVMLDVVEECRRVLAPHGSLCFELGDTYAGSGGAGGDYGPGGLRDGQERFDGSASKAYGLGAAPRPARNRWRSPGADPKYKQRGEQAMGTGAGGDWPLDKSLCLVPELLRVSLAYGFNPLTGRQTPRWRVRNVVRWCRPNPPVGALADKVRPATSDILVACTSRKRYFDLDAVRTEHAPHTQRYNGQRGDGPKKGNPDRADAGIIGGPCNPNGAPPLDHWWHDDEFDQDAWLISTEPYKGSHYATFPRELCVKPIEAMCPRRVCRVCGEPSRRLTQKAAEYAAVGRSWADVDDGRGKAAGRQRNNHSGQPPGAHIQAVEYVTTGWSDCGHDDYRPGLVLDPFAGSGTTLAVADGHGRDAIGVDLDARNAELARQRVGMWLTVEHTEVSA